MLNLLTSPRTARTVRGLLGTLADTVADFASKASDAWTAVVDQTQPEPVEAPDPAGLYTEDEIPELADIERAALGYDLAADSARSADRAKRKHRRLLDRLPSGRYGAWLVRRVTSNRQTPDLVAIRATYERLGLGDIPMRDAAPSLRVERIEVLAADETLTEVAV